MPSVNCTPRGITAGWWSWELSIDRVLLHRRGSSVLLLAFLGTGLVEIPLLGLVVFDTLYLLGGLSSMFDLKPFDEIFESY